MTRTRNGWVVVTRSATEHVDDLVVGLCLADLVLEEAGVSLTVDRAARRSARGRAAHAETPDPRDARIADLERTVAQLEHALAGRVSIERAIGALAERHGIIPRLAFDSLRRTARASGRAVAELAAEVLAELEPSAPAAHGTPRPPAAAPAPPPRTPDGRGSRPGTRLVADGPC